MREAAIKMLLDFLELLIGGAGGNRTRVRKPSTGRSTYLDPRI